MFIYLVLKNVTIVDGKEMGVPMTLHYTYGGAVELRSSLIKIPEYGEVKILTMTENR